MRGRLDESYHTRRCGKPHTSRRSRSSLWIKMCACRGIDDVCSSMGNKSMSPVTILQTHRKSTTEIHCYIRMRILCTHVSGHDFSLLWILVSTVLSILANTNPEHSMRNTNTSSHCQLDFQLDQRFADHFHSTANVH